METKIYLTVKVAATIYLFYRLWIFLFCRKVYGLWDKLHVQARITRVLLWSYRKRRMAGKAKRDRRKTRRNGPHSFGQRTLFSRQTRRQTQIEALRPQTETKPKPEEMFSLTKENNEVIGKTKVVYFEDPEAARNVPARSEPLPESGYIGEEEDINPDDVEDSLAPDKTDRRVLTEAEKQELMSPAESEPDSDFSTALTFEQLGNVAEVLMSVPGNEEKNIRAAEILFQLKDSDLFSFFVTEMSTQEEVERLLGECLDERGCPKKHLHNEQRTEKIDWNEYM